MILTVPHTPATEGFFNRTKFRLMKPGAFFINIGRGMTTKLDDLVATLKAGEIAGAALDVYEQEPLPADSPERGAMELRVQQLRVEHEQECSGPDRHQVDKLR